MIVVYFVTITGIYPVFPENYNFGALNDSYLYSPETHALYTPGVPLTTAKTFLYSPETYALYTPGVPLTTAKTLTMLMVTIFFCESFLVFQIRRPNSIIIRCFSCFNVHSWCANLPSIA